MKGEQHNDDRAHGEAWGLAYPSPARSQCRRVPVLPTMRTPGHECTGRLTDRGLLRREVEAVENPEAGHRSWGVDRGDPTGLFYLATERGKGNIKILAFCFFFLFLS